MRLKVAVIFYIFYSVVENKTNRTAKKQKTNKKTKKQTNRKINSDFWLLFFYERKPEKQNCEKKLKFWDKKIAITILFFNPVPETSFHSSMPFTILIKNNKYKK